MIAPNDRERMRSLKAAAAAAGWHVLYDPNLRHGRWADRREMLDVALDALRDVAVVKPNADEARALTGEATPEDAAAELVRLGPRRALVTVGAAGAFLATPAGVTHVAARDVEMVDTTGAGDAVAAVLAAGLARGAEVTPALVDLAMQVAGGVVAARGAVTGLPTPAEARSLLPV
jgi:sugar/nucleoside kinase (ribokinase family)